ncbi:hypothetical protein [Streptomyces telluris]|uniref:Uncharacterized protein n=1 Tax=Streptomyces telluris TaxID=2720021 RepID=A0A9X2LJC7_9ACTN|nr:hypothetical protein [Streptomyces telluris]MCQ8771937.1 hypothetical protein [Streptomyces telluris]NJP81365.1 hypothetical protein [Streptomyces telluris]
MTGRRGEKPAGHRKAVPRDMQDQQAAAAPERDRAGPAPSRGSKNARKAEGAGGGEQRTDRTGDLKQPKADEPPD